MSTSGLPTLNAVLNATSALLLLAGYRAIRRRAVHRHRRFMMAAFGTSVIFLLSYLRYHAAVGSVPFQGLGWVRTLYFAVLVPHVVLAAVIVPLALGTLWRAWRGEFQRHRRLARVTFPLWLYVSGSGVVVYLMLYHR